MNVTVKCPSCFLDLTVEHSWDWVRCGCGRQFSMPPAVASSVCPPGYQLALTGLFVRPPGLWAMMSGRKCPNCHRRGYVEDGGTVSTGQRQGHRREWTEERFFGPAGSGPELGRSQREVIVPTTIQDFVRLLGCAWCGYCWQQAEQQEL